MNDPKLFDFAATLKHETENGLLVNDGDKDFWLPKKLTKEEEKLLRQIAESKGESVDNQKSGFFGI